MAIGLSNVNNRKAKRATTSKKTDVNATQAIVTADLKTSTDAWSTRGLAREGRSARRERSISGEFNPLWLDWTSCVAGGETPTRLLQTVRRILDLETFVFEFLVYDLQIPMRAKKQLLGIRSRSARALQIRKLLLVQK